MAAKRNGLGKGLDSLIPNKTAGKSEKTSSKKSSGDSKKEDKTGEVMVKINSVEPNREQPRKDFDEDSLVELADSIKQFGILQPLIVQQKKDYYEIIAGERRWRAAKMAGIKEVPVIIKNYTDQEIVQGIVWLVNEVRYRQPRAQVEVIGLLPRRHMEERVARLNESLAEAIQPMGLTFRNPGVRLLNADHRIDESLFLDGLHLTEKGYDRIAPEIASGVN